MLNRIIRQWAYIPHNSKYCLISDPLFYFITHTLILFLPLYMKKVGVTDFEIGFITSITVLFEFVFHLFAVPFVNKYGRRRSYFISEIIAWVIPIFLWSIAYDVTFFVVAAIFQGATRIGYVAWFCIISEDEDERQITLVYALTYIIIYSCNIIMPLIGSLVEDYGLVKVFRVLYSAGSIILLLVILWRNNKLKETPTGYIKMRESSDFSLVHSLLVFFNVLYSYRHQYLYVKIISIYAITNFIVALNIYQVLYLNDHIGYTENEASVAFGIASLTNVILYVGMYKPFALIKDTKMLFISVTICLIGSLLFLFIKKEHYFDFYATITIITFGGFLLDTYRDAALNSIASNSDKGNLYSVCHTFSLLFSIPAGVMAGYIFEINRTAPFIVIIVLFVVTLLICYSIMTNQVRVGAVLNQ